MFKVQSMFNKLRLRVFKDFVNICLTSFEYRNKYCTVDLSYGLIITWDFDSLTSLVVKVGHKHTLLSVDMPKLRNLILRIGWFSLKQPFAVRLPVWMLLSIQRREPASRWIEAGSQTSVVVTDTWLIFRIKWLIHTSKTAPKNCNIYYLSL